MLSLPKLLSLFLGFSRQTGFYYVVDQARLELTEILPASVSQVLGLKVCTTTPGLILGIKSNKSPL